MHPAFVGGVFASLLWLSRWGSSACHVYCRLCACEVSPYHIVRVRRQRARPRPRLLVLGRASTQRHAIADHRSRSGDRSCCPVGAVVLGMWSGRCSRQSANGPCPPNFSPVSWACGLPMDTASCGRQKSGERMALRATWLSSRGVCLVWWARRGVAVWQQPGGDGLQSHRVCHVCDCDRPACRRHPMNRYSGRLPPTPDRLVS